MRSLVLMLGLVGAAILPNPCSAQILDNPFSQYIERGVTITPGAGNAKDTNAAIHTIDPWPPYAGYTRIPGEGQQAVDSVEHMYHVPDPFGGRGQGQGGPGAMQGGASTGTSAPTQTQVQPISSGY